MELIGDHLRGLFSFAGREPRQRFWLWVLVNYVLLMLLSVLSFVPLFSGSFGKLEQFAREHPDQVTRTVGPGSYSIEVHGYHPELMPDFGTALWIFAAGLLVIVFLLAAAVVRRLHDSGRSGWWGIMPVPFLFGTFWGMSRLFTHFPSLQNTPDTPPPGEFFQLFGLIMIGDLCYLATLILLIVFCCMPTQPGDNRFGPGLGGGVATMNLLTRHLTGLLDFQGRENRQPFWLWILIVYIVQFVLMAIAMIPLMTSWFDQMMPVMQGDPHRFDKDPQAMIQLMMPMMQNMIMLTIVSAVLFFILTAAAVVRRLHDSNRSGWWVTPYYAMQIVSPIFMASFFPRYFSMMASMSAAKPGSPPDFNNPAFQQAMQSMTLMSLVNILSFAILVMMIVFLVLPGTVGPNRFGNDPLQPPFH